MTLAERAWRTAPATDHQRDALRKIAMTTGVTFVWGIRRGEAWDRIAQSTRLISPVMRARCAPPGWGGFSAV